LWVILTGQSLPIQGRAEFARFGGDLGEPAGEPGGFVALLQATELGVQFTTFNLNEFGEKPSGVGGGRFGCYVSSHISLDTEVNHFPENPLASEDRVVIAGELATRIKGTRKMIESAIAIILTVSDGEISRFQILEDSFVVSRAARS
jgi:hypothetical protein